MSSLIRTARVAELAPSILGAVALFALMLMTFADVVMRSAFDAPLPAATELTRILMAVVVFAGMPVISARGDHIAVDLLDGFFPRRMRVIRDGLINIACGVLLYWPGERVVVLAERARSYGDVTEYLAIPDYYPTMFIACAVFLTGALMVARGVAMIVAPRALAQE